MLAVLAWMGIVAGLASPPRAEAQERCEMVSGAELDALRNSLEKKASLRDSLQRILVEAGAYDSAGALLVWTDEEEM